MQCQIFDDCMEHRLHVGDVCHTGLMSWQVSQAQAIKDYKSPETAVEQAMYRSEQSLAIMPTCFVNAPSTLQIVWVVCAWWKQVRSARIFIRYSHWSKEVLQHMRFAILHCRSLVWWCAQQSHSRIRQGQYIHGMSLPSRSMQFLTTLIFFQFWMLNSPLCPSKILTLCTACKSNLNQSEEKASRSSGYAVESKTQSKSQKACGHLATLSHVP